MSFARFELPFYFASDFTAKSVAGVTIAEKWFTAYTMSEIG